jgi:cholesterol 7-desaturase
MKLRKYPTSVVTGLIFVWVHAVKEKQDKPEYDLFCIEDFKKQMNINYRGSTYHEIKSHIMDIPENGADVLHFKYVHK